MLSWIEGGWMWECRSGLVSLSLYMYARHLNLCQIVLRGVSAIRQDRASRPKARRGGSTLPQLARANKSLQRQLEGIAGAAVTAAPAVLAAAAAAAAAYRTRAGRP